MIEHVVHDLENQTKVEHVVQVDASDAVTVEHFEIVNLDALLHTPLKK